MQAFSARPAGEVRRRILFFSHTRQVSGAERVLLNMLAVLDKRLYETSVCCPVDGQGDLDVRVANLGATVYGVAALNARFTLNPLALLRHLISSLRAVASARGAIRRGGPDLVHANSIRAGLIATLATFGTGTPVLWHIQDELPPHPISSVIRAFAWMSRRTRFVAVSRQAKDIFTGPRLSFGDRIRVLHNGVDLSRFPRKNECDRESVFRRSLGLGPDDLLFVSIGLINPRKGLIELVDSFSRARPLMPANTHLALVGAALFHLDEEYLVRIRSRIAQLALEDCIHLVGPSDDIDGILRTSDLLILNAYVEPFGLVLVEAAASGTPILASETGGAKDILAGEPPFGFITPPPQLSTTQALAECLISIANDSRAREEMAERAYRFVRPRFSLEAFCANLNALYHEMFAADRSTDA